MMSKKIDIPLNEINHISFNNWSFPVKDSLHGVSADKYFATSGEALVKLKKLKKSAEDYVNLINEWIDGLKKLKKEGRFDYLEIDHLNGEMIIRGVRKRS